MDRFQLVLGITTRGSLGEAQFRLAPLTDAGVDELSGWVAPVVQYYLTGTEPVPKEEQS